MAKNESWTCKLKEHCQTHKLGEIVYQDVSDRRGGRTAWSTIAVIKGQHYQARFWYDGAFIEQAREDAAEVALLQLRYVPVDVCRELRN